MADESENDEQWLYGENHDFQEEQTQDPEAQEPEKPSQDEQPPPEPENKVMADEPADAETLEKEKEGDEDKTKGDEPAEDGEVKNGEDDDSDKDLDDDDSDDDVNVVIGDIKSTPSYTALNIKRGGLLTSSAPADKSKQVIQPGKFSVEEFDQIGTINGVPATEYNLDSLEDKPWRKPGADITDYFNYGFNEDTWRAYCERQKRMRVNESGVGLAPMNPIGLPRGPVPIMNDNSKYSGNFIGSAQRAVPPTMGKVDIPKVNTIQVMTADRREYSRKPTGFPDMSVPPPSSFEEYQPEYGFNPEPEPFYGGYEPTQDSQWGTDPNWAPSDIKSLTPGPVPMGPPPHMHMAPPMNMQQMPMPSPGSNNRRESPHRESRDRDRESRGRSEKPRDRDRERSHRRERSRSKSRRNRSRSRSPSHRSHRKKKSRRHEDSD